MAAFLFGPAGMSLWKSLIAPNARVNKPGYVKRRIMSANAGYCANRWSPLAALVIGVIETRCDRAAQESLMRARAPGSSLARCRAAPSPAPLAAHDVGPKARWCRPSHPAQAATCEPGRPGKNGRSRRSASGAAPSRCSASTDNRSRCSPMRARVASGEPATPAAIPPPVGFAERSPLPWDAAAT